MTSSFPEISISTDRLVLRAFEPQDVPALSEMMADELVRTWTTVPHGYRPSDAASWVSLLAPAQRTGGGLVLAVHEFLTQRLVGSVRLRATDWRLRSTEAEVITAPWARGEGYAGEALRGVARWLFEDQRFERLELRTAAGNSAAQQVAQKIGCISEGVLRSAWIVRDGEPAGPARSDLILWSLLPEDLEGADPSDEPDPHW
ncbi:GNAT family N-acetyltransferase [Streptacidiphilus sp. 4-A2]|nr:GNAT family N-acetyltransferase [Streptacidiphilus sp. 4-A2]